MAALADESGASRAASSLTRSEVEPPNPIATSGPSLSSTGVADTQVEPGRHHRLHDHVGSIVAERLAHHGDGLDDVGFVGQVEGHAGVYGTPEVAVLGLHRHGVTDGVGDAGGILGPAVAGLRGDDAVGPQHGDDAVDVEAICAPLDGGRDRGMGTGPVDVADLGDGGCGLVGEPRPRTGGRARARPQPAPGRRTPAASSHRGAARRDRP